MTVPPFTPSDLCALTAKLRQDDEAFRRSFALGCFGGDEEGAKPAVSEAGRGAELRARFLALIESRTGIEAGGNAAERADRLLASMPAAAIPSWLSGLEMEPVDSPGWEELVDLLTVHETYFFRDPDQLEFLRRSVLPELIAARRSEPAPRITAWCAGCSSGEEVYTLAMLIVEALREAGEAELRGDGRILIQPRWRLSVLGTDIDRRVLAQAQGGRYADFPMGPFRSLPDAWTGYFEPASEPGPSGGPAERMVRGEIRALTRFLPHNLAGADPPTLDLSLVFCRNVLIYLSDRARRHAQALFHRALARDGVLALGPTDVLRQPELFQPYWGASTVLYRKK
ncbi:MAG: protein-glutamate O-methyltransferase CheR [Rhodospirillaceae bacterium]